MKEPQVYWWRLPDDEAALMALGLAELKCYLVVVRAIQRDRNGGKLSLRQITQRARLRSLGHVHTVMAELVNCGMLTCNVKHGKMAVYGLPNAWRNCSTGAEQSMGNSAETPPSNCSTGAEQHCSTGAEQHCSTGAEQHLKSLEFSESLRQSECTVSSKEKPRSDSTTEFSQPEAEAIDRHIRACGIEPSPDLRARLERKARFYGVNGFHVAAAIERARRRVQRNPSWRAAGPGWIVTVVENELQGNNPRPDVASISNAKAMPRPRVPVVEHRVETAVQSVAEWRRKSSR